MSYMLEVLYKPPVDLKRESQIGDWVSRFRGNLTFREGDEGGWASICLTYEFDDRKCAEECAASLRKSGEHVEGPVEYAA